MHYRYPAPMGGVYRCLEHLTDLATTPEGVQDAFHRGAAMGFRDTLRSAYAVPPAAYALSIVALVTWQIAITLFIAMHRNIEANLDEAALDGTAFTLLSALIALWTGFGVWAGRSWRRKPYLAIAMIALCGIALIAGLALLYMAIFFGNPFSIPSNVAQLLILTTSALVSIAGSSIGYTASVEGQPPELLADDADPSVYPKEGD